MSLLVLGHRVQSLPVPASVLALLVDDARLVDVLVLSVYGGSCSVVLDGGHVLLAEAWRRRVRGYFALLQVGVRQAIWFVPRLGIVEVVLARLLLQRLAVLVRELAWLRARAAGILR